MTEGYLINMDALKLGLLSMSLGAGRKNKEDNIDYSAGIIIHKNINDYINSLDSNSNSARTQLIAWLERKITSEELEEIKALLSSGVRV